MQVAIHIAGMLAALAFSAIYMRTFGRRPTIGRVCVGLAGTLMWLVIYGACTMILHPEGHSVRLPVLMGLCTWAALACIRPTRKAMLFCLGMFLYFFLLWIQFFSLATSNRYTDQPEWRLRNIRNRARSTHTAPREVKVVRTAHTWLTGLYRVEPPLGESPAQRFGGQ